MNRHRFAASVIEMVLGVSLLAGSGPALAQTTTTYIGDNNTKNDRWSLVTSWDNGIPAGELNAVIPAAKLATAWSTATPAYTGDLTISNSATVGIGWTTRILESYNALGTPGSTTIFMYGGSLINMRMGGSPGIPAIQLLGNARVRLGSSTQTPASGQFGQGISGAYRLTLESNAGAYNTTLSTSNGFSELVVNALGGRGGNMWTLKATAAGALGTGDVTINPYQDKSPQLYIGAADVMADTATLSLNGAGPAGNGANMVSMNADDTIAKLFLNGVQQPYGTYGKVGHGGVDYEVSWMTGDGLLTVPAPPSGYWDLNGATAGAGGAAPAGTWDAASSNWNSNAAGTNAPAAWTPGRPAVFAAGADATGTYAVAVSGTQDIGGLAFEEGTVTLSGGELRLTADSIVNVASGLTAMVATVITNDATARPLSKSGDGTLILSGTNTYAGITKVEDGTLSLASLADAGTDSNIGSYPAAGAAGLVLVGGTLRLTGGATNIDRGFTLQGDCTLDVSAAGTALTLGACASSGHSGTLTVTGGAGSSLALGELTVLTVSPTLNPTVGGMTVASAAGDTRYGNPAPTLTLGGTTTGNLIPGNVIRINRHPSGWDPGLNVAKAGTGDWTISGAVDSGNATMTVNDGTLTLSGTSSYSGVTAVNGGTLIVGADAPHNANGALGKTGSEVTLGAAGGNTDASILIGGPYAVGRKIRILTSDNSDAGVRVLTLGGNTATNSTFSGAIYLGSNNNAGYGITLTAAEGGQVTFSGAIQDPSGMDPTTNTVVTKAGAGTVVLSGVNTYTADTIVEAGTLVLAGSSTLLDSTSLWIADGATVDLADGVNEAVTNLYLNAELAQKGTWGSSGSEAELRDDANFSGTGILTVLEGPFRPGTLIIVR